jgi:hypothetical protein
MKIESEKLSSKLHKPGAEGCSSPMQFDPDQATSSSRRLIMRETRP